MCVIIFRILLTHEHTTADLKTYASDPFIMSLDYRQHANKIPNTTDN